MFTTNDFSRFADVIPAIGPKDPNWVDVSDDAELLYWASALVATPEAVIQAAKDIGGSAGKVESRLLSSAKARMCSERGSRQQRRRV